MPEVSRTEHPYLQVATHIRDQITSGALKDGELVPSTRQIAQDWGVSMATAARALSTLRAEGLVRGVPGVGTVVQAASSLHRAAHDLSVSIKRTGKIYPPGYYAKIRSAELVPAPERVAEALGIEPGAPAIRRQRTQYTADDVAWSTSVSWFAGDLASKAPQLLVAERIQEGTPGYIAAQTGRETEVTYVQHAAGDASAEDAAELGVAEGASVLLSRNRYVDANGDVIEYGESTSLPGQWVFYEYKSKDSE